jgi:hypothetical protein
MLVPNTNTMVLSETQTRRGELEMTRTQLQEWGYRVIISRGVPGEQREERGGVLVAWDTTTLGVVTIGKGARIPLLLTGVQQSPGTQGRTDKNLCRCFGAPARRVFPDHLITRFRDPAGFRASPSLTNL